MAKKDLIWSYYHHLKGATNAKCKQESCSDHEPISTPKHSTKSLKSHLSTYHKELFEKYLADSEEKKQRESQAAPQKSVSAAAGPSPKEQKKSQTLTPISEVFPARKVSATKEAAIDRIITEMIALDMEPFAIVERVGFQRLMQYLEPGYTLKNRDYYGGTVLSRIYEGLKDGVMNVLADCQTFSFTIDTWSDTAAGVELLSLTCHTIDSKFERHNLVLGAECLTEAPTGAYMAEVLCRTWDKWEIEKAQVHIVLRDGAKAMEKLVQEAGVMDEWCLSHVLQLVVKAPMESHRMVKDMLARSRAIASHFHHSGLAGRTLGQIQLELGEASLQPIQDVPTRWNSTYLMVQRMLRIKSSIVQYSSVSTAVKWPLTANDWSLMEKMCEILEPFYEATLEISKDDALMSISIPLALGIKKYLEAKDFPGIGTIKDELLIELQRRIGGDLETKNHLIVATFIDPRRFPNVEAAMHTRARELIRRAVTEPQEEAVPELALVDAPSPPKRQKGQSASIWDKIESVTVDEPQPPPSPSSPDPLTMELHQFESQKTMHPKTSGTAVLAWWAEKQLQNEFPILREVARRYLAPPPTTVDSERLFSKVGLIYEAKRKRLKGEKADMLLFLNANLPKCGYKYAY